MQKFIKWIIVFLLAVFVPYIGPVILFLYFFWGWFKLSLKVFIYSTYLTIRIPIFFFIQVPLRAAGVVTKGIDNFFHDIIGGIFAFPRRALIFAVIGLVISGPLFGVSILALFSNPAGFLSLALFSERFFELFFLLFGAAGFVIFSMTIYVYGLGKSKAEEYAPALLDRTPLDSSPERYERTIDNANSALEKADEGVRKYRDIKQSEHLGGKGSMDLFEIPSDIQNVLLDAGESVPFLEMGATTNRAGMADAKVSEIGGVEAAGAEIGMIEFLLIVLAVYMMALITGLMMTAILWIGILQFGFFSSIYGPIVEAVAGILGFSIDLSGDYGNWLGTTFSNEYLAGASGQVEGAVEVYTQAKARVFCLLRGPACLRQQFINNTERPGSDDVGETYGLEVDEFTVGRNNFDIRRSTASDTLPVSFSVSNPRRGLKGIEAQDLAYRIQIIDSEREYDNPYCDTGWMRLNGSYDTDGDGITNDLYPGTAASTGFAVIDDDYIDNYGVDETNHGGDQDLDDPLTLKSCELLQPGAGATRTAVLYLKYDYFSQATLYFDAMSLTNFRQNQNVQISSQNSETADTPVQAAMSINDPILFDIRSSGPTSRTRDVRTTLNTDKDDVYFQVKDFSIRGSRFMEQQTRGSCTFDPVQGSSSLYTLGFQNRESLISDNEGFFSVSEPITEGWFDRNNLPPTFGCDMRLTDDAMQQISPNGETLTMGVAANYTVAKRNRLGNFKTLNRVCARADCPLLVTAQQANEINNMEDGYIEDDDGDGHLEDEKEYNFRTTCRGLDSSDGCSAVVHAEPDEWHLNYNNLDINSSHNPSNSDPSVTVEPTDTSIEDNEIVLHLGEVGDYSSVTTVLGLGGIVGSNPGGVDPFAGGVDIGKWKEIDYDLDGVPDEDDKDADGDGIPDGEESFVSINSTRDYWSLVQFYENDGTVEVEMVELDREECLEGGPALTGGPRPNAKLIVMDCGSLAVGSASEGTGSQETGTSVSQEKITCSNYRQESQCNSKDICTWESGPRGTGSCIEEY